MNKERIKMKKVKVTCVIISETHKKVNEVIETKDDDSEILVSELDNYRDKVKAEFKNDVNVSFIYHELN